MLINSSIFPQVVISAKLKTKEEILKHWNIPAGSFVISMLVDTMKLKDMINSNL